MNDLLSEAKFNDALEVQSKEIMNFARLEPKTQVFLRVLFPLRLVGNIRQTINYGKFMKAMQTNASPYMDMYSLCQYIIHILVDVVCWTFFKECTSILTSKCRNVCGSFNGNFVVIHMDNKCVSEIKIQPFRGP